MFLSQPQRVGLQFHAASQRKARRFMTLDLLDRITNIGNALSSNLDKMTEQERKRYRHFLKTELRKVDQQQTQESNDINKKGD